STSQATGLQMRCEGRSLDVINFHQANAAGICHAADDRGVGARREGRDEGRFVSVSWGETELLNLIWLSLLPVVVTDQGRTIGIFQIYARILKRAGYTKSRKRWSDGAHHHPGGGSCGGSYDQPANHDVVASFHKSARGDVGKLRISRLVQIIRLHYSDA